MIKILVLILVLLILFLYSRRELVHSTIRSSMYLGSVSKIDPKYAVENRTPLMKEWYTQKIPLKFHQTDNSRLVDYSVYKAGRLNQQTNPEYEFFFYDEQDRKNFIATHFPQYTKHYDSVIPGAYKVDLFRLLVLYKEGGVYMDSKSFCIASLREMIQPTDEVYLIRDVVPESVYNGFICSTPGHPLIKMCIDRYIANIEKKHYGISIFDIGGPQMVGRMVNAYLGRPELTKIDPFEKDGVRVAGTIKKSHTGEDVIVSEDGHVFIERSNSAYLKRKQMDTLKGRCYSIKWWLGKVYK
jgi:mannosyltransferase OCH1-like enzyme